MLTSHLKALFATFAAIFLATVTTQARSFMTVPTPDDAVIVSRDSLHIASPPAMKVSYDYKDFHTFHTVTVYNDSTGTPTVAVEKTTYTASGRVHVDTTVITPDGMKIYKAKISMLNGELEKHTATKIKKADTPWDCTPPLSVVREQMAGLDRDSHGNWTSAHGYYGNKGIDPESSLTREISYSLSPDESAMLAHYEEIREQSYNRQPEFYDYLGFILLAIAAAIASYGLKNEDISNRKRRMLAGPVMGVPACAGIYMTWIYVYLNFGTAAAVVLCAVFLSCWAHFHRVTVMRLEDDFELSNHETRPPIVITSILLFLTGWLIGASMWGVWWAAILTAGCFMLPMLSVPDRGERCARCHRMGAMVDDGTVDAGTKKVVNHEQRGNLDAVVTRVYSLYRTRRKCRFCGYEYLTYEKTGEILSEVVETTTPVRRAPQRSSSNDSSSSSDSAYPANVYCSHYVYPNDKLPGCAMHGHDLIYPCNYENNAGSCPYFRHR